MPFGPAFLAGDLHDDRCVPRHALAYPFEEPAEVLLTLHDGTGEEGAAETERVVLLARYP